MFRPNSERKLVNVGQQTSSPLITGALPPWRSKMTGRKTLGILGKKLGMTQLFRNVRDNSVLPHCAEQLSYPAKYHAGRKVGGVIAT